MQLHDLNNSCLCTNLVINTEIRGSPPDFQSLLFLFGGFVLIFCLLKQSQYVASAGLELAILVDQAGLELREVLGEEALISAQSAEIRNLCHQA